MCKNHFILNSYFFIIFFIFNIKSLSVTHTVRKGLGFHVWWLCGGNEALGPFYLTLQIPLLTFFLLFLLINNGWVTSSLDYSTISSLSSISKESSESTNHPIMADAQWVVVDEVESLIVPPSYPESIDEDTEQPSVIENPNQSGAAPDKPTSPVHDMEDDITAKVTLTKVDFVAVAHYMNELDYDFQQCAEEDSEREARIRLARNKCTILVHEIGEYDESKDGKAFRLNLGSHITLRNARMSYMDYLGQITQAREILEADRSHANVFLEDFAPALEAKLTEAKQDLAAIKAQEHREAQRIKEMEREQLDSWERFAKRESQLEKELSEAKASNSALQTQVEQFQYNQENLLRRVGELEKESNAPSQAVEGKYKYDLQKMQEERQSLIQALESANSTIAALKPNKPAPTCKRSVSFGGSQIKVIPSLLEGDDISTIDYLRRQLDKTDLITGKRESVLPSTDFDSITGQITSTPCKDLAVPLELEQSNVQSNPCPSETARITDSSLLVARELRRSREPKLQKLKGGHSTSAQLFFKSWREDILSHVESQGLDDREAIQFVKDYTKEEARDEVEYFLERTRYTPSARTLLNLMTELSDAFVGSDSSTQLRAAFYSRRQLPKESEDAYGKELQQLARKVVLGDPSFSLRIEEELKAQFVNGLIDKYISAMGRQLLVQQPDLTFARLRSELARLFSYRDKNKAASTKAVEAVPVVTEYISNTSGNKGWNKSSSGGSLTTHQPPEVIRRSRPQQQGATGGSRARSKSPYLGKPRDPATTAGTDGVILDKECYYCHDMGHLTIKCPRLQAHKERVEAHRIKVAAQAINTHPAAQIPPVHFSTSSSQVEDGDYEDQEN